MPYSPGRIDFTMAGETGHSRGKLASHILSTHRKQREQAGKGNTNSQSPLPVTYFLQQGPTSSRCHNLPHFKPESNIQVHERIEDLSPSNQIKEREKNEAHPVIIEETPSHPMM